MSSPNIRTCGRCGKNLTGFISCSNCAGAPPNKVMSEWVGAVAIGVVALILFLVFSKDDPAPKTAEQIRQEALEHHFNPWNGSHTALAERIRSSMQDPRSFEHVSTFYNDHGDTLFVEMTYRGTNAFGAIVT